MKLNKKSYIKNAAFRGKFGLRIFLFFYLSLNILASMLNFPGPEINRIKYEVK